MWMEERGKPINVERVSEAAATGADTLAVACPYCTVMLDDGVQSAGAQLRVVDVATLLAEALDDGADRSATAASRSTRARALAFASAARASSPSSAAPTIGSLGETTTRAFGVAS